MARKIKITKNRIIIDQKIEGIYEKTITKFGTGAKIDAQKQHIGKKAYIIITQKD